ncbi:MAG TPA: hypothetical protein VFN20_08555 [Candidatus Acidoferrum sp.]|jgi:hypothetical protein|nr:hypothetical protein [Candidatus Acidoferrum sp.]
MRKTVLRIAAAAAITIAGLATTQVSSAQRVGPDTIALFPKNVGEFAYANLKQARSQKWFPQLQQQLLPERFRQFEKFLASAGVDPNTQVEELVWGLVAEGVNDKTSGVGSDAVPTGEEVAGIAMGNYNPSSTEAFFKAQKLPTFNSHGFTMYAFGSGAGANDLFFLFLDSNMAAFGHRNVLEKMLDIRYGGAEGMLRNDKMYSLINEANGSGVVWAVLNPAYTRLAVRQLAPQIQQFPEAAKLVTRMQNLILNIQASGGVDGKFQAICGNTDDANTLAQLMQLALVYQQYQAKQQGQTQNQDLADLLSQAQVNPSGDRVVLRLSLTDDQMTSLIKKNTFALKM